jgi:glyoxylate/hydroxypyruvate reductase
MIYGTGKIGQTVAKTLSSFGVEVYGVSLSGSEKEYFKEIMQSDSRLLPLNKMDFIINTLPLTEKTESLFNESFFRQVSNVGFINVGRGASLDEKALLRALNNQYVRFAVLDVFTQEPLPKDNKLWNHPNVWITPHISAVTTPHEGVNCFIETLKNIEENKPLVNKVDVNKGF